MAGFALALMIFGMPTSLLNPDHSHAVAAADCKCLASSDCENGLYHGKIQHCGCEKDCGGGDQGHNIHWPGNGNEGTRLDEHDALRRYNAAHGNSALVAAEDCHCLTADSRKEYCDGNLGKHGQYKCGCDTNSCSKGEIEHWPGSPGGHQHHVVATAWPGSPGKRQQTSGQPPVLVSEDRKTVTAADCKCLASSDCENGLYHGKIQHCGCEKDCGGGDQGHNIHWPGNGNEGKAHGDSALVAAEDCHCLNADSRKEFCDGNLGKHGQYKCGCDTNSCSKGEIEHWPGSPGGHQHHVAAADCKCLASSDCENGLYHGKIQHCGCEKDCGGGDQGHNIHWPGNGNAGKAHVKTKALNAADAEIEGCKCLPDGECENQKEGGYKCGCDTATCILVHWPGSTGGDDQDAAPSPDASPSPETPDA
jgi:hypothetical protein